MQLLRVDGLRCDIFLDLEIIEGSQVDNLGISICTDGIEYIIASGIIYLSPSLSFAMTVPKASKVFLMCPPSLFWNTPDPSDRAYSIPQRIPIPPGTRVPALEVHTVQRFLARQKRTAPGPDGLPHWMWRDFSHLLAPVITKLFNCSLQEQFVPCHWKLANVTPIPKESPLTNCHQL